jgi:sterol 3beta-glucosyltransferase
VLFRHARSRWRARRAERTGTLPVDDDEWSTMRICIPLDRVSISGNQDYHSFCTLVGIDVEIEEHKSIVWHPEQIGEGDFTGSDEAIHPSPIRLPSLKKLKSGSPRRSRDSSPERKSSEWSPVAVNNLGNVESLSGLVHMNNRPGSNIYPFNIAVLSDQSWFVKSLEQAVAASKSRHYKEGVQRPSMVFDIGGYDCFEADDDSKRKSTSTAEIEREEAIEAQGGSLALNTHKQEKAAMAAKIFGLREEDGIWSESSR